MAEFIFLVLTILFSVVSAKVDEWITISALGFKSETPPMFLRWEGVYIVGRLILWLLAAAVSFAMTFIPWYTGLVILVIAWLGAGRVGKKKGFNAYRRILREMMESADTPEQKAEYETESKKSDQDLVRIVKLSMKLGI